MEKKSEKNGTKLAEFFVQQLKDIYWAEKHLVPALNKMKKAATSEKLQAAFEDHRSVTEIQVKRLEEVFEMLGKKAVGKKCEAMEGLIKEAEEVIEDTTRDTMTRDAALIVAAQKVEHYEIASYGSLVQIAKQIGFHDAAEVLAITLEEKETDELLTSVAESFVNEDAVNE